PASARCSGSARSTGRTASARRPPRRRRDMTTPSSDSTGTNGAHETGGSVLHRLHTGTGAFDIVGKRRRWYVSIGLLFAICIAAIGVKGFNLGIDFEGGTKIQMPAVGAQGEIGIDAVESSFQEALDRPAD